jgi:hypothetical protein
VGADKLYDTAGFVAGSGESVSKEPFGWIKTIGGLRKTHHWGRDPIEWFFVLTAAAYNLMRIPKLLATVA